MSNYNPPYLFLDIGGTKTRLSFSLDAASLCSSQIFVTPDDFDEGLIQIASSAKILLKEAAPSLIIAGVPGPLDQQKSVIVNPPNLPNWKGRPLKEKLKEHFNCPVFLENDTALVGLGEAVFGAGRDYEIVSYLTVSTGVNGVKIIDGKIDKNFFGFEVGHQIIDFDDSKKVGTSGIGELEDFISGREIQKRFGKKPEEIADPKVWAEVTRYISIFVYHSILYWSPEVVVLGGSIIGKISLDLLRENLSQIMKIFSHLPEIRKCQLGDLGGLYGALVYAKSL